VIDPTTARIVLVEDDESHAELILRAFEGRVPRVQVDVVRTLAEARKRLGAPSDLVITDWRLPDGEAGDLLAFARDHCRVPVVVMTSHGSERVAVEVMKAGAIDYVVKSETALLDMPHVAERARRAWEEVAERERMEQALRESERRWQFALEGNGDGVWDWNTQRGRIFRSRQWKAMLGYEPGGIGDAPGEFFDRLHPEDRERVTGEFDRFLGGESPVIESEFRLASRDGGYRWILCRGQVMERMIDGRPLRCIGTHRDITRRREAEEALRASEATMRHEQKLKSLGTLAGGVAHEINNPVNIIMNFAELIRDQLPAGSPAAEDAGHIISESSRIARIVKDLLSFSRQEQESHSPARVRDIVDSVLSLTGKILARDQISVSCDVSEDLPRVVCRSQQIMQVVMNLITNARDALNERYHGFHEDKRLSITARVVEVGGRRRVRTTVEDRGAGIPEAIRDRLFDPFFTTKARDAGTGLGLAVSYGIVKEHHGELTFESAAGGPTRFHVDLPVAEEA
jgi:PAS domain S-box-containing protein